MAVQHSPFLLLQIACLVVVISLLPVRGSTTHQQIGRPVSIDKPIVLAGAGPASLFFSLRFLELNKHAKLEVFEKRPAPPRYNPERQSEADERPSSNAFGFGIGARAQDSLGKVPGLLGCMESVAQPLAGPPGLPPSWMINRQDMCAEMIHKLQTEYPSRIKFHFDCHVIDLEATGTESAPIAVVQHGGQPSIKKMPYSLLIGADGTFSSVRTTLERNKVVKGRRFLSGTVWKALQLPQQPLLPNCRQSIGYKTKEDTGRLLPLYKDRFVLLNFRSKKLSNSNPFQATNPPEFKESLQQVLPNVTMFPSDPSIQEFLDKSAGDTVYMNLNRHYAPQKEAFLLGDAAVGMYNFLGQGCAYAMLSANRLAEGLAPVFAATSNQADVQSVLSEVASINQLEGKSLADLNLTVHLIQAPLFRRLRGWLFRKRLYPLAGNSTSYSDLAKQNKGLIRISKVFWLLARVKVPSTGK